ncbi:MAG: AAA family ATPase [Ferruginibacter sp.]|nr:AAA family ATPase [Cytophagales bacterium]
MPGIPTNKQPLSAYQIVDDNRRLFERMRATPQDPVHHREGDVYTHTEMVLHALLDLEEFGKLSDFDQQVLVHVAILHDVAKPDTLTVDDQGRIANPKHAGVGANVARKILDTNNHSFRFIAAVYYTILFHGYPFWILEKANPRRSVIQTSLLTNNHLLYVFAKADLRGRVCDDAEEMRYKLDLFREWCLENGCYDRPKVFKSAYDRFHYFNVDDSYPDTELYHQYAFEIYMLSGLPASGKDHYVHAHVDSATPVISLDDIREELDIDPTGNQGRVVQLAKERSKEFCRKKQSFVWNATNISRNMRSTLIATWLPYHPKIHIVFVFKNINQTLRDNAGREREDKISNQKIMALFEKVQFPSILECHTLEVVA